MTLGQMGCINVPAHSAGSFLIWQNPKSTLRHLPQRHRRLPIASSLGGRFLSVSKVLYAMFQRFNRRIG